MNILEAAGIMTRQGPMQCTHQSVSKYVRYRVRRPNALPRRTPASPAIFPGMTEAQQTHVIDVAVPTTSYRRNMDPERMLRAYSIRRATERAAMSC